MEEKILDFKKQCAACGMKLFVTENEIYEYNGLPNLSDGYLNSNWKNTGEVSYIYKCIYCEMEEMYNLGRNFEGDMKVFHEESEAMRIKGWRLPFTQQELTISDLENTILVLQGKLKLRKKDDNL